VTFTFTGTGPWDLTYTDGVTPTTVTGLTTSPYTINVSTLGTYTATVVSDAYCTGTSSGSAPVTSNSLTNVTFSPLPNVCVDLPSFPLTGGSPSGGVYSGTGVTAGVFDPATAGPGTFTITYTYTDINGCTNSAQQTIQVGSSLTVTINPTDASICKGGSVNLQCTAANTVHWTPGTGLSDSTVSMVVASPTHTTTYTVTCTTSGGCSGSATITISVYDNTLINFSAVPSEGCQPLKVQFNYTPGLDIIDSSWVWNFDDIISDTAYSTLLNPTHTYILEGDYHVILNATTTAGCLATDTVTVHVYPMPLANFIMHPDIASMDNPAISFVDMSTHASQWSWFFDDPASGSQDYSIIANPVHIFTDSGTYHVILIVETSHGCRDTATKPITIYPELLIYVPNAFTPDGNGLNDQFRPVVSGIYLDTYTMEIFDRWGEEVFKTTDVENGWDGRDHSDKVCESGVFSWIIHYTDLRGKAHKMLGHVSIIR
jgi:gliding motility-associated-like protein